MRLEVKVPVTPTDFAKMEEQLKTLSDLIISGLAESVRGDKVTAAGDLIAACDIVDEMRGSVARHRENAFSTSNVVAVSERYPDQL